MVVAVTAILDVPASLPLLFLVGVGICAIHLLSIGLVTGLRPEDRMLIEQLRNE